MIEAGNEAARDGRRIGPVVIAAVLLGLIGLPVFSWLDLRDLSERMLRAQAGEIGRIVGQMRNYYSDDVVGRVLQAGGHVEPTHRYREVAGGIPIPATLSIELGKRISAADGSVGYRFVSDLPFKGRAGHELDAFEAGALAALRRDPRQPVVEVSGSLLDVRIRAAAPVLMAAVCVACHNAHPDSPKNDWKVGEVRGIEEITVVRPIAANVFSFKYLLFYFAFSSLVGLSFIALQRRQSGLVRGMNAKLLGANDVLAATNAEIAFQKQEIETLYRERSRQNDVLEAAVKDRTRDLVLSQDKLRKLIEHGIRLGAERDEKRLLEGILLAAKDLANADGGTLYIKNADGDLAFQILRNSSLGLQLGGTRGGEVSFPPVKLTDPETGQPNYRNVASYAAITGQTVNVGDAYAEAGFDFSGTREFDDSTGYRSQSFLTVPLKPRQGDVIGVLQLINAKDPETGRVGRFAPEIEGFVEALATQAAVALDNQNLLKSQKALLDSFIELIASAIDAKSPHTGGHCSRVPELARLLAEAACDQQVGPFADFDLSDEQWYEFHIAAWLHDCGKITTPEHVVDKATKLEGINNRIHEIRTRFEVLIRDAEVACLKGLLAGREDPAALVARRDGEIARLTDDFAFVAACNIGRESMDEDDKARVKAIAERSWSRHLDDRLGLSNDEAARKAGVPAPALPVREPLLDDREDHIVRRAHRAMPADNPWGFRMDVPEHADNHGEVYNLCIDRGTLTPEERFRINDHIVQTIIMLEQLPFPDHLKRVPEYAGGHHETMIGTGYPRKLRKDDVSVPARIMAIADIFEALTDPNRPYKKDKSLPEALRIMSAMAAEQHIDADLFRLFLTAEVYRAYADRFLAPGQMAEIDIREYLL